MGTLHHLAVRPAIIKDVLTNDLHTVQLITSAVHCLNGYQKDQKGCTPLWSFVKKRLIP